MAAPRKPAKIRRKELRKRWAKKVSKWKAEVLLTAGILLGWLFITLAVIAIVPENWDRFVAYLSVGLLAWAAVGYGFIMSLFWEGLYLLSREDEKGK
jgi:hypothetical protein